MRNRLLLIIGLLCLGSTTTVVGQDFKMRLDAGYAGAMRPLANYTSGSFLAGMGAELEVNPWLAFGADFHYAGFPLDTSRNDFAATTIPLQLYAELDIPTGGQLKPYLGSGVGLLFVRYVFAQGISVRQSHLAILPRTGLKYEVDDEFTLNLNFTYLSSVNQLSEKGEGDRLSLEKYSFWMLGVGMAYTISN